MKKSESKKESMLSAVWAGVMVAIVVMFCFAFIGFEFNLITSSTSELIFGFSVVGMVVVGLAPLHRLSK